MSFPLNPFLGFGGGIFLHDPSRCVGSLFRLPSPTTCELGELRGLLMLEFAARPLIDLPCLTPLDLYALCVRVGSFSETPTGFHSESVGLNGLYRVLSDLWGFYSAGSPVCWGEARVC